MPIDIVEGRKVKKMEDVKHYTADIVTRTIKQEKANPWQIIPIVILEKKVR